MPFENVAKILIVSFQQNVGYFAVTALEFQRHEFFYLRAVGRQVLWSAACVCLSVCVCARTVFVRKISQKRVHGSPPNLVGGSRG